MKPRWTTIPVPLVAGLDTKTDEKAVPIGKLTDLQNGVFTQHGSIGKRNGYDILKPETVDSVAITGGRMLAALNDELLQMTDSKIYSYSEAVDRWIDKGAIESVVVSTKTVSKLRTQQTVGDCATSNDVTVYAWEDSRGTARYSVVNETTGASYVNDNSLGSNTSRPRVVAVGDVIHIYFFDTGATALKLQKIIPSAIATSIAAGSTTLFTNVRAALPAFDVCTASTGGLYNPRAYLVYTRAADCAVLSVNPAGTVSGTTAIADVGNYAVSITAHPTAPLIGVCIASLAGGVIAYQYGTSFGLTKTTTLQAATATTYRNITCAYQRTASGINVFTLVAFWEKAAASVANGHLYFTQTASVDSGAGAAVAAATFKLHSGLGSKAFATADRVYVHVVHHSTLQSTYFLARQDGVIIARILPGTAGGLTSVAAAGSNIPHLPSVSDTGDGWVWCGVYKTRLESATTDTSDNPIYTEKGIKLIKVDFDSEQSHRSTQIGNTLYIAGGHIWQYDGHSATEAGFHLFPENITAVSSNGSGSINSETAFTTPSYSYRAYYEWVNAKGEREQSSYAGAVSVTFVASDDTVTLTIPTLSLTEKRTPRSEVSIAVYRSEGNPSSDSAFYRVSSLDPTATGNNGFLLNDPTTDTVTFVDGRTDLSLITGELDYQNTGELDNITPPPFSVFAAGKGRVFLSGFEDPNLILYSKVGSPGKCLEFNDALTVKVDEDGGPVTGMAVLNESLVIFKRRRVYVLDGDGPSNLGIGGFNSPALITSDAGCTNQKSISVVPDGLVFQSEKGIYLLTQSRQLVYVGAPVEAYNDQTITGAVLSAGTNQVRFLADTGRSLMYDYLFREWSTWTQHSGVAACLWLGKYCYLKDTGRVYVENQDKFTDGSSPYQRVIETAWVNVGGVQGMQRVREVAILGQYKSAHNLQVSVAYDYEPGYSHTVVISPEDFMNTSIYGDDALYGDADLYGGSGSNVYQARIAFARQKCTAFRLRIVDIPKGDEPGESFSVTHLAYKVAGKRGPFKPNSGKNFGVS
jgi:hypothetical protein